MTSTPELRSNGRLTVNADKKGETHPDFKGYIYITEAQLDLLGEMKAAGQTLSLNLGGWKNVDLQTNEKYIRLRADAWMKPAQAAPRPAQPAAPPAAPAAGWDDDDIPF